MLNTIPWYDLEVGTLGGDEVTLGGCEGGPPTMGLVTL